MKKNNKIKKFNEMSEKKLDISDVRSSKEYTTQEVKDKIKELIKDADFLDFTKEYGIMGWEELDKWLKNNIE